MKKNVLITLFALILLSLMSCGNRVSLKVNEIVVDTTVVDTAAKLNIKSILTESGFSKNIIDQSSAIQGIQNYVNFTQHDFNPDASTINQFSEKIPTYHIITTGALDTFLRVFKAWGAKNIAISQFNMNNFDASNPYNIDCKLIFFGFDNAGQVINSSQSSIFYLNDMKRCPPDSNCTNLTLPVSNK